MGQRPRWFLDEEYDFRYPAETTLVSNCCSAGIVEDTDLCCNCLEHCEIVEIKETE